MSVLDLKQLYPTIELMDGYDAAFVGIVPGQDGSCLAVYDSMKIVNMLHKKGFSSQEELLSHFEKMVSSAQKVKKVGPLFMQYTLISETIALDQDEDDEIEIDDEDEDEEDAEEDGWNSDSDSDSDHDWNDGDDPGEEGEEGEEGNDLEESGYDEDVAEPYMEITVDIGINDPDHCVLNSNANKIKEAIRIIFPNLPRLDMVGKAKFILRNLDEMED